jgi:allophanate hydrolase subunit 1
VAIVDNLCVIYPNQSPGGWNIIGRTPQCMFDKNKKYPTFVNAGYSVKFKSISKKQFGEMKKNNE